MEYRLLKSSSIRGVGYDPQTQSMEITFCSGGVYLFYLIPKEKADGLINAKSPGTYFATEIQGKYEYKCLQRAPSTKKEPKTNAATTESKSVQKRKTAQAGKIQPI